MTTELSQRVDLYDRDEQRRQSELCVSRDGDHEWVCMDHYGHPTGEQLCYTYLAHTLSQSHKCDTLRHHPDETHVDWHFKNHARIAASQECWCVTGPKP